MTTAEYTYDPHVTEVPDKHDSYVQVGDFIRNGRGEIWRVTGFRLREGYEDGNISKRTGLLDRHHSHFDVERPTNISGRPDNELLWSNLEPMTTTGVGLSDAEYVDDPQLIDAFERQALANAWKMIDIWEGRLAAKRSELQRREERLATR